MMRATINYRPRRGTARWKLLGEANTLLDSSPDYEATLRQVAGLTVPAVADFCSIRLVDGRDNPVYLASAAAIPVEKETLHRVAEYGQVCLTSGHLVPEGGPRPEPRVFTLNRESMRLFARHDGRSGRRHVLHPSSVLVAPLVERERMLGVLVFGLLRGSHRRFGAQDVAFGGQLAKCAALAISHARMRDAARKATRTREQLLATLSHDLKSPIGTMRMAVDFALELLPQDTAHREVRTTLQTGRRAADHMLRLVHDLLDVAAIEEGRLVVTPVADDPRALVAEVLDAHRLLARARNVVLESEVSSILPSIHADHERLLQALGNLTGNAVKFTPAGGRVRVQATSLGDQVRFAVGDTGPGIPASEQQHIFDRFWRGKGTDRSSTGLGLAIARGIIEAHGGTLTVESQPGVGSEFAFTIPICQMIERGSEERSEGPGRHRDVAKRATA